MRNDQSFPTIRQAAARGPLSESCLRIMQKQGNLPGFFVGNTFRVNYPMLLAQLDRASVRGEVGNDDRADHP